MNAIAYLLMVLWASRGKTNKRAERNPNSAADKHRDDLEIIPSRVQVSLSEKDKEENRTYQEQQHALQKSIKRATWATFWAVSIYAAITGALWVVNKQSADAAQSSLGEARTLNHIQYKQMVSASGAFPDVPSGHVDLDKGAHPFRVWFDVVNVGKSRAVVTSIDADIGFLPDVPDATREATKSALIDNNRLAPGQPTSARFDFKDWTPDVYAGLKNGNRRLYIWGKFTYTDRFGPGQTAPFCRYSLAIYNRSSSALPCDCWDAERNESTQKNPLFNCSK